ncbi:ferredoxin--NADP reductase [Aestuariibacter sp. AA17]|uniref:ferredoxin--NADP(+) reductase n=1 Tax=Fluctibacter corallii TaxID=2984329 RepID=A0ABT3ACA3_9ALTE|nr:ferredoxin--NADP reductase [Aestuariibacter sp. AA17]MCV2886302.1 ferredoxin--NADP reductase [Aestuariibacter sp. AA17]
MAQWLEAKVIERIDWNEHLFSLKVDCPNFPKFIAGQFTKLGLLQEDGKVLSRAYSLVNSPDDRTLEILAVPVENGLLSPKLHILEANDSILIMSPATGYLTLDEVPKSKTLWMMATGTGVGPFISILRSGQVWQEYENIVLVYAVRQENDLAYLDDIRDWKSAHKGRFSFVPIISREKTDFALHGRIPALLEQKKITGAAGLALDQETSQVMLCGNPQMIKDAMDVLKELGLTRHLRRSPGNITLEQYW